MALPKVPWNKGKGQTKEEKQAKRAAYYRANRERVLARVKAYHDRPEVKEYKKGYTRWHLIKSKYGVTKDQWHEMYSLQEGKCGLCKKKKDPSPRQLVVDHDHQTGEVRKLLCHYCNIVMGVIDNENLLREGLEYKREFSQIPPKH